MLKQRFTTDANLGGVEKVTVASASLVQSMADVPRFAASEVQSDATLLPPMSLFCVKGWTRIVAASALMVCCWENPAFLEAAGDVLLGSMLKYKQWQTPFDNFLVGGFATVCERVLFSVWV